MENVIISDFHIDLGSKFHALMHQGCKTPGLWGLLLKSCPHQIRHDLHEQYTPIEVLPDDRHGTVMGIL